MTLRHRVIASCLSLAILASGCSKEMAPATLEGTTTGAGIEIQLRSPSGPPTTGTNTFEAVVRKDGVPVTDATVTAVFSMPAMPSMNMPAMQSTATLIPQGNGSYQGTSELSMAGTWNVKVAVVRNGETLGAQTLSLVAK
jgi:hypothetical protein